MTMKIPGPDHPITLSYAPRRVRVLFGGHLIADSADVLTLKEANYPPVYYFPRADVAMADLARTDHRTYCPYKGLASYFTVARDGEIAENAVWSYETPYPAMALIEERLAFYADRFAFEEDALDVEARIRDIIEHTDDGSGRSQSPPWPPNVEGPPAKPRDSDI
jgi:uncharacterized protein (DUF427 family)